MLLFYLRGTFEVRIQIYKMLLAHYLDFLQSLSIKHFDLKPSVFVGTFPVLKQIVSLQITSLNMQINLKHMKSKYLQTVFKFKLLDCHKYQTMLASLPFAHPSLSNKYEINFLSKVCLT